MASSATQDARFPTQAQPLMLPHYRASLALRLSPRPTEAPKYDPTMDAMFNIESEVGVHGVSIGIDFPI